MIKGLMNVLSIFHEKVESFMSRTFLVIDCVLVPDSEIQSGNIAVFYSHK